MAMRMTEKEAINKGYIPSPVPVATVYQSPTPVITYRSSDPPQHSNKFWISMAIGWFSGFILGLLMS